MDHETLSERMPKLENELFEYQYNMGLLLIEKKEWNMKFEELTQALADASDALKRERLAQASAMSEVEKREENLKKALGVERQCVLDLEKALREMRSEYAEIKFNADSKLAEANALVTSVEEKSLEIEAKFHAADAKLAEVSRKSSEIDRKLHELEVQENVLRRERSFFTTEREVHDASISKQREDLGEWERKLQESEERLDDGRRLLNQREEKSNDNDKLLMEKQNYLEELRRKIEVSNSALRNKEEDISSRLASLALKEKETDDVRKRVEEKEKQLLELEEKLNTREKMEIQKLLSEHNSIMAEKEKEFELEMEQKRKLHDEQLKDKVAEVEKKEAEITHMEEKMKKREQAVEKKLEKVREKEMDFDSKSKALKEREKSLKSEQKDLDKERKQMVVENGDLVSLKAELENLKAETEKMQLKLSEEREQLKITEDERAEYTRLQLELKQEIDKYRFESEQLAKEADNLKLEKEKFEKEWEELGDKRAKIKKEQEDVLEEKSRLEKLRLSEEERLHNEKLETQQYVESELETLKLAKDSFAASMEHEKSLLAEEAKSEKTQLSHEFEMQKQDLEAKLQVKLEEAESSLHHREKLFEQEKEKELNNINYLREVARREMEDMKLERLRIEKEKMEIAENKKHVETQQFEMKKDIEELVSLSQKLKDQREQFISERERFVAFAEKQKNCNICGETIRKFMLSDLEAPPLPKAAENFLKEAGRFNAESSPVFLANSGSPIIADGTTSWFKKCTSKILNFSAGKKLELDHGQEDPKGETSENQVFINSPKPSSSGEKEPELLYSNVANNSSDVRNVESDSVIGEVEAAQAPSVDQEPPSNPENSPNTDLKSRRDGPSRRGGPRASRRTRSAKAVIAGSKANGDVLETSAYTNDERVESDLGTPKNNRRKRNRPTRGSQATLSDNQTEGHSDSIKDGDHPKRRQRVDAAAEQTFGQSRYNFRNPKRSVGTVANGSLPRARRSKGKETEQPQSEYPETVEASGEEINEPRARRSKGKETEQPQSEYPETVGASREEINEPVRRRFGVEDGDDHVRSTADASEFSADSPFKKNVAAHVDTANTRTEGVGLSEEVNGTADEAIEYSFRTESQEDDDGDDNEVDHPGEVSMGKKLWTFLTT